LFCVSTGMKKCVWTRPVHKLALKKTYKEEETKYISTGWLYHSWDNALEPEPEKLD